MESGPTRIQHLPRLWPSRAYYGWAIVFTSFFISIAQVPMYGPVFSVFMKPIEDELGWSRFTITVAFTVGSLGGALLASAVGPIVDRYGARGVMSVTGLLVTAGLLGISAMSEPWHFWVAYGAARTVSVAGVGLGTSVAIANWFIRMRGRAIAMRAAGQRAGQAVMPLIILPVLLTAGWRESFVVLGIVAALFITVPSLLFIRRRPEDFGLRPDGDSAPSADTPRARGSTEYSWTLREVRTTRTLWLLTVGMAAGLAAQIAINVHAVANFEDKGIAQGLAVTVASIFTGVAAVSMLGWGMLVERIHVRYVSMAAMALFFLAMGVLLVAETYAMAVLFAFLFGLGTGGWTVAQMIMIPNYFGRLHAGSIKGFISPVEGLLGISGPLVAARVHDATDSYDAAFVAAAATFALGCAAFYLAKPLRAPSAVGATA
ncbi:MAG: MFS transporter [Chloroflexota bacterium]|nr:MFS transporter [Chloroflexota bacterium]MDE2886421.1 MFS transporter [Chloroflexota bacterium]